MLFLLLCMFETFLISTLKNGVFFSFARGLGCRAQPFSSYEAWGPLSSCGERASHRSSSSCLRAQAPGAQAPVFVAHRLRSGGSLA